MIFIFFKIIFHNYHMIEEYSILKVYRDLLFHRLFPCKTFCFFEGFRDLLSVMR